MTTFEPINPNSPSPSSADVSPASDDATLAAAFDLGAEPGADNPGGAVDGNGNVNGGDGPGGAATVLTKDQFFELFRGLFAAPNMVLAMKGEKPLESLKIDEGDASARGASDALYETCEETPWLRFMIAPGSVWAQRVMVVGAFAFGRAQAVTAEIAARRPPPAKAAVTDSAAAPSNVVTMPPRSAHVDGQAL